MRAYLQNTYHFWIAGSLHAKHISFLNRWELTYKAHLISEQMGAYLQSTYHFWTGGSLLTKRISFLNRWQLTYKAHIISEQMGPTYKANIISEQMGDYLQSTYHFWTDGSLLTKHIFLNRWELTYKAHIVSELMGAYLQSTSSISKTNEGLVQTMYWWWDDPKIRDVWMVRDHEDILRLMLTTSIAYIMKSLQCSTLHWILSWDNLADTQ